jgi:cytochrome c oxidase cbb3-type subunit 3
MSDFVSDFWSVYIAVLTALAIVFCVALLMAMSKRRTPGAKPELHGHVWDEDLAEYNNPLPRWWIGLFYITIVFSVVYLVIYPGFGSYAGAFAWTSSGQYDAEAKQADNRYGPTFSRYLEQGLAVVAADAEARAIGQRLFLNYCAQCHGSDAGGGIGFPSLRDKDWLYGGEPEIIKASIMEGRNGVMPALGSVVGGREGALQVANYVLSLSGRPHDTIKAVFGKEKFAVCAGCHGADGKGGKAIGAPNLTDDIWLYGGSQDAIIETILMGRKGLMPAHKDFLGEAKVHVLAAYIYSLSVESGVEPAQKAYGEQKPAEKK